MKWTVRGRGLAVVIGLVLLTIGIVGAVEPFRQTREFRAVVACEERSGDCLNHETDLIVDRRMSTAWGGEHPDTRNQVVVQRPGGMQYREILERFNTNATPNQSADLWFWRGELVGIEMPADAEWFLPESSKQLIWWLILAALGLGILLWGLFFGWWDGWGMAFWRIGSWALAWLALLEMATRLASYGPTFQRGDTIVTVSGGILATAVGFGMVVISLRRQHW